MDPRAEEIGCMSRGFEGSDVGAGRVKSWGSKGSDAKGVGGSKSQK